ncbi:MAG: hypothetical protein ACM336_00020 [Acidobacteriota bacterium]
MLTPLVRNLALRYGWVDQPGERKIHASPIPRTGGIAIAIAYMAAFGVLFLLPLQGGFFARTGVPFAMRLLPAARASPSYSPPGAACPSRRSKRKPPSAPASPAQAPSWC